MAKATTDAAIPGYSKEKMGAGWKGCPECKGYVKGPTTKVCPACEFKFTVGGGKTSKRVRRPGSGSDPTEMFLESNKENNILRMVLKHGGFSKITAGLNKLTEDPMMAFAIQCGGIEAAKTAVAEVEASVK